MFCSARSATPATPSRRSRWARALAARGHDGDPRDLARWQERRRGRGDALRPGARVPRLPHAERPLKPYEAVVRATVDTRRSSRRRGPTSSSPTSSRSPRRSPPSCEGVPVATLVPHVYPRGEPGFPPYSIGARLPRTAPRAADVGGDSTARRDAASSRARASSTRRGAARPAAARPRPRRDLAATLCLVATLPPSSSTRGAWPEPGRTSSGRCMWEPPFGDVALPRRRRPARARRAVDRPRTRGSGCCAPRSRASPTRRCGCSRRPTAGPCPLPCRRPGATPASSTGSPTRARCRTADVVALPRRPRDGRPGAGERLRRSSPCPPRAT